MRDGGNGWICQDPGLIPSSSFLFLCSFLFAFPRRELREVVFVLGVEIRDSRLAPSKLVW